MNFRLKCGLAQETIAANHLKKQGIRIITRNFQCKLGEIDIIAQESETLIFIEVRFRKDNKFLHVAETINFAKQQKIIKTAQCFLLAKSELQNYFCRFDVICLLANNEINWIKNAFQT